MARHALSVIAPQGHVGTLAFESTEDRYEFVYDPGWPGAVPAHYGRGIEQAHPHAR